MAVLATTTLGALPSAVASAGGMPQPTNGGTLVDTGKLSAITQIVGATAMWNAGFMGAGVDVAVIDTGVARVPGLAAAGKVIDGPDLSFDSQVPSLAHVDAFGHGTHIAAIIAGTDVVPGTSVKGCKSCSGVSPYTDTTKFVGVAPESRIVNVKVGAHDGAVDVTQIIAGIDWVVQHHDDPGLNIRVINLSFGTNSVQDAMVDPLVYAVERAWDAGIVVVAAGGNDGHLPGPLANPAVAPSVIAVGSTDPMGTMRTDDDEIGPWAQHGTPERGIDVSVPGKSVKSLAVPYGFVDQNVTTGKEDRYQRATGTSQSAAVVSGMAALLLQRMPYLSPDSVKALLTASATPMKVHDKNKPEWSGAGTASFHTLARMSLSEIFALIIFADRAPTEATGTGSIEGARGDYHVSFDGGPELRGEIDIFGQPWDREAAAWSGGRFHLNRWSADTWAGDRWPSAPWAGTDWAGALWHAADGGTSDEWSGARWSGARWSGARWSGARWSDAGWSGARWSGARWSEARHS